MIAPILLANGLGDDDVRWLRSVCSGVPVIHLKAGIRKNSKSLLPHGVIIDLVSSAGNGPICLQDADCFVSDPAFWDQVVLNVQTDYAAGPFWKASGLNDGYAETFFVVLNRDLLVKCRRLYGITSEVVITPRKRARPFLIKAGLGANRFPEESKDYFDTLQQFWVVAEADGFKFRRIDGANKTIHHIGGTSYLHNVFDELSKWDYWPLNVHYFHLRILEQPEFARFQPRFESLFRFHRGSQELLESFPEYRDGWRRKLTDSVLRSF
jgi:hypothetical protein